MGFIEWAALGTCTVALIAVIGVVVRLMDRINKSDALAATAKDRADAAAIAAASVRLDIERVANDLTGHRVSVAREYVSKDTLASLENRIVEAIRSLGDRIDNLFNGHVRSPK